MFLEEYFVLNFLILNLYKNIFKYYNESLKSHLDKTSRGEKFDVIVRLN